MQLSIDEKLLIDTFEIQIFFIFVDRNKLLFKNS